MPLFSSVPSNPPPITAPTGLGALQTLPTFSRVSYLAASGVDAPTYDTTRLTKGWLDTSADPTKPYTYSTYVDGGLSAGTPVLKTITIPGSEAASLNLPGVHSYPPYVVEAAPGVVTLNPDGTIVPEGDKGKYLCNLADANNLAALLGLNSDAVVDTSWNNGQYKTSYPPTETRRLWGINVKGVTLNAETLIIEMNANGVGAPGKWDLTGAEPNWISGVPSSFPPPNPAQPIPMRVMNSNEGFTATLMGWEVEPTNQNGAMMSTGSGGLTSTQDMNLTAAAAGVAKIMKQFNIT